MRLNSFKHTLALLGISILLALAGDSPAHAEKELTMRQRHQLFDELQWSFDCERRYNQSQVPRFDGSVVVYPLNADLEIIQVLCDQYAYQESDIFLLRDKRFTSPQKSITLIGIEGRPGKFREEVTGMPAFDPKTLTLTSLDKARGMGDCGQYSEWRFNRETTRFELQKRRELTCENAAVKLDSCNGYPDCQASLMDPETWPQVYPAQP